MSKAPPLEYPRDGSSKRGAKEKTWDLSDPNDNAFLLVSVEMLFFCVNFFFTALIVTLDTASITVY